MRICQARNRIPCAIPRDIATMSDLFRLPRRRHSAQTHSFGVWTSSITVTTGKLMRPGKVFGHACPSMNEVLRQDLAQRPCVRFDHGMHVVDRPASALPDEVI